MKRFAFLVGLIAPILASVSLSQTAPCPDSALRVVFSRRNITINDTNRLNATIKVKLNRKPSTSVVVFLGAPTLQLSNCSLTFTRENFNMYQTVKVIPDPMFSGSVDPTRVPEDITAVLRASGPGCQDKRKDLLVKYDLHPGKICSSYGDPHIKSFDGACPRCPRNSTSSNTPQSRSGSKGKWCE